MHRAEDEIARSDENIAGDVYIGAGEADIVRLFAEAAKLMQDRYPDVHYHITSGNAEHVLDQLDKGLIDFGIVFGGVDSQKYEFISLPVRDSWGVLMRRDSPLAGKDAIRPEDLWDKPLIISRQRDADPQLSRWLRRELYSLNVVATYNLVFNASLLVDEGVGYALCLDRLINTSGSGMCFRPLEPALDAPACVCWKKYQAQSKAALAFLAQLRALINA